MRILVTGGTGTLGRELVPRLQAANHAVRVMTRRPHGGEGTAAGRQDAVERVRGDLATGDRLTEAVTGVDVVAHLASVPNRLRATRRVDVEGTRRLVTAARAAGVRHLVYVSIVGVDRIPWPYYKAKLTAEQEVRAGGLGWSILRATQFHTFLDAVLSAVSRLPVIPIPAGTPGQPVDPAEVAERLVALIGAGPDQEVSEFGGPEVLRGPQPAYQWLRARGLRRRVVPVWIPGRVGRGFRAGYHLTSRQPTGRITWEEWLSHRYGMPQSARR
jgi:uncharacterized protein YbjT (DUF2867 family)